MAENGEGPVTQNERILRITTPLGEDHLLIQRVELVEGISRLPFAECVVLHDESKEGLEPTLLDVQGILGQPVNIFFETKDGATRVYNGIVNSCAQMDRDRRFTYYKLTVVPSAWMLTQTNKSRIFQHIAIPELLKTVLADHAFELQLGTVEWKPRNYVVQYRESDFDFISRLMEEEGIFYYFRHEEDSHKMIICVDSQSHEKVTSKFEIPYHLKIEEAEKEDVTYIDDFVVNYRLQTGKVTLRDHSHQKPADNFETIEMTRFSFANNQEKAEHYLYPSGSIRKYDAIDAGGKERSSELQHMSDDIKRTAKTMQESIDARHRTITAHGICPSLVSGHRFKLTGHPVKDYNAEYVITSISHSAVQSPHYYTDMPDGGYSNSFECISWGQGAAPFRPQQVTPRPMILTSQTATVVGPKGEEIHTDKYGRVKVQFHWDREGEFNESSSCWARVSQHWAGNKWGSMFIPRIGMEVLVHFLEGDPDQPIITGCVYKHDAMPPYDLPEHKTKSGVKTDSTTGGGGFNELRFEDKKGKEHIFLHAQKDQHIRVKSVRREYIGGDRHLTVGRDKREKIGRDSHILITGEKREEITKDKFLSVDGKSFSTVTGDVNSHVSGSYTESVTGAYAVDAGSSYYVKAQSTLVLEATAGITLKVGGNFITVDPSGVYIQGTLVLINSGGAALPGTPGAQAAILPPDEAELPINADPGDKAPTYKQQRAKTPPSKRPKYEKPPFKPKKPVDPNKPLHWIEIQLNDDESNPVPYEEYQVEMPDGSIATGSLNGKGFARIDGIDPAGNCKVSFPNLDKTLWKKA